MKQLTVVQLLPELNGGGVERGTLEIAKGLVETGHRSIVISNGGRLVAQLEAQGSQHITLAIHKKSLWSLWQVSKLRKIFDEIKPDIIHARSRMPAWLSYLAWKRMKATGAHFVTTVHGLYSVNAYSKIMVKGERVIAVSETVCEYIKQHYPDVPTARVTRIFRGISPSDFSYGYTASDQWMSAWLNEYPQLRDKKILCLPGRLTRLKGHHDFIDLMAELVKNDDRVMGIIVGGEDPRRQEYAQEIRNKVDAQGLTTRVLFIGHRGDIREIYSVSDIVFSLSNKPESFGRTVLEPLAMKVPVLAYAHGGVAEILEALFPAGAIEVGNNVQLLERTKQLLHEPKYPKANERFTLDNMINETLAVYQELSDKPLR